MNSRNLWYCLYILGLIGLLSCGETTNYQLRESSEKLTISTHNYQLTISKKDFRFGFSDLKGQVIAPEHPQTGLRLGKKGTGLAAVSEARVLEKNEDTLVMQVKTTNGLTANVLLTPASNSVRFSVNMEGSERFAYAFGTGGGGTAYGMSDHAAVGKGGTTLELDNFIRDTLKADRGGQRMLSNFVIFPREGFAAVNIDPELKMIRVTGKEMVQGSYQADGSQAMYYFIGEPKEIYQQFLAARNREGYPVYKPKSAWFGVGWEAFGALAWNTNHRTVRENIDRYLKDGYPLKWMVVGSGFWPRGSGEFDTHGTPYGSESKTEEAKLLQATTSFGMWDKVLYPDPKGFINYFHQQGLIFTIGLRTGFIPGGPFSEEGVTKGYFIKDGRGEPALFQIGFPRVPVYLLDTRNKEATNWYVTLCKKWLDYGVDGFKEDLFGWPVHLQDDLIDPVNRQLMEMGVYIMGRNNYLGSPADIHRYNDFNYNQVQDRGPINGLAYAFSGFPYVYPDIIGGTGLATGRFGKESKEKLKKYLIRYAQYAAMNPSMAFGFGPWNFDPETSEMCLKAAQLHERLVPYIYSNAVRAFETGYPYPMTPLPLAYPQDDQVYGLADTARRSYEWLIGESLLAAPVFGNDYETAFNRDVYLPEGKWIDYEDGTVFNGPVTLDNFEIPLNKIPLFVGGNGVVVEQEDGKLYGRIYPVKSRSETIFTAMDGETKSRITVNVHDWKQINVVDALTKTKVPVEFVRHAWQFELTPGRDFLVK